MMQPRKLLKVSTISAALVVVTLGSGNGRPGPALEVASLSALLWYALVLVVSVAYAVGRWGALGWRSITPLAALLLAVPAVPVATSANRALADRAFSRHITALEATVAGLSLLPGGIARLQSNDLPQAARSCCSWAIVRRDSVDRLSAVFLVHRELAYLYDPTGTALERALARRWRHQKSLAPHWHRLAR